jgi:transposase
LVSQHLNHHRSLAELAAEAGISLRCAYKWLARYRTGGAAALADRRSVRRTQRWRLDPQQLEHAVELRHIRTGPYTTSSNCKAERFIQTLCWEWA